MSIARRDFLVRSAALGLGFAGLGRLQARGASISHLAGSANADGFGPLVPDPYRICDLPAGFSYQILSRQGETMDDGLLVPGRHDGMAAFEGHNGLTILVRNHEVEYRDTRQGGFGLRDELFSKIDRARVYDAGPKGDTPAQGGTTTLFYNTKTRKLERHFMSLAGTVYNCAGGPTPWGSWLTCEETTVGIKDGAGRDHGWVFEVPARDHVGLADPVPLKAMGRFRHEAVAFDPRTGICYLTEDRDEGLLYRFIATTPGRLRDGGRLQALALADRPSHDTTNWSGQPTTRRGEPVACTWIDLEEIEAPKDDLRNRGFVAGAARFARGEGCWFGGDALYFCCTSGGPKKKGQLFRYRPGAGENAGDGGTLELFVEPDDASIMDNPDNITAAPWGDLIVCEDGAKDNYLLGITPAGEVYKFARTPLDEHEWAGACFSPDGSTMFVNSQRLGITLAIRGPWKKRD